GDILQQAQRLLGARAIIEGRDDLERLGDLLEVCLELGLKIGGQHDSRTPHKIQVIKRPDGSRPGVGLTRLGDSLSSNTTCNQKWDAERRERRQCKAKSGEGAEFTDCK